MTDVGGMTKVPVAHCVHIKPAAAANGHERHTRKDPRVEWRRCCNAKKKKKRTLDGEKSNRNDVLALNEIQSPKILQHLHTQSIILPFILIPTKDPAFLRFQFLALVFLSPFADLPGHVSVVPMSD
jgi:hypothetical protein